MLSMRLRRIHVYIFGFVLLGFVLSLILVTVNKPKLAQAGGAQGSCSIAAWQSGSNTYSWGFRMDISAPDASFGSVQPGHPGTYSPWTPYLSSPGANYYNVYSSSGNKTVYGRYSYVPQGSSTRVEVQCQRTIYVSPPANQQATAWVSFINCDAATGALTFYASVNDPDGGTPGYYLSIQNIGDTGWIYRANGAYPHGAWYPPRDGATYSISIWAADAQTGTVVGPGITYYSCAAPPPSICTISNIVRFTDNSSIITAGDRIKFNVRVVGGAGWTLGVNGSDYGNEYPGTDINNYLLVSGSTFIRGPTVTTADQTFTVTDIAYADYTALNQPMNAPGLQNGVVFNWGLVKPGIGWAPITCSGSFDVKPPAPVVFPSCSLNTIATIEPGETYQPRVTIVYSTSGVGTATVTATVTVNGSTNTATTTVVPGETKTIDIPPPIVFNTAGDFPVVTKSISGTINGYAFGPIVCGGATSELVVRRPYFKVFNGSTIVGAGFNSGTTTCTTTGTGIVSGFASNTPSYHGASVQYDLKALAPVASTFYSSGVKTSATPGYKALTFANTLGADSYGGSFGGTSCITDYYTTTRNATVPLATSGAKTILALDTTAGAVEQVDWAGGTLSGGSLGAGGKLVVYVTGDVYITGNITLHSNYNLLSDIPFFALVVKGNIMIAPGVTQLDGLYIAQPNGATGGTIYTCATSSTTIPASTALYGTCASKLTFNGSVVAKSIKLLRTNGTLRNGPADETASSANIAEVFNGMPELFIANPAFRIDVTTTELYDSITSLPPLL